MKKISFFIMLLAMLASCSNDELVGVDSRIDEMKMETKSAADKIFTAEIAVRGAYFWAGSVNVMCTDMDGNLYFIDGVDETKTTIKKYDLATGETSVVIALPFDETNSPYRSICVDASNNIYYAREHQLYKISAGGTGITDFTARFGLSEYASFTGLCAADNGNVFVSTSYGLAKQSVYRIAANGNVKEIVSDIMYQATGGGISGLAKPKGAFVFGIYPYTDMYLKANTTTGEKQYFTKSTHSTSYTAALNQNNIYAIENERRIVQVRPNAANDLLIGTLPDYIRNENNEWEPIKYNMWRIAANADATVFYAMIWRGDYNHIPYILKLTLD